VGSYQRYRYGIRWFGDYRGAVPGAGPTFCLDLRFWYPDRDYKFEQIAKTYGLANEGKTELPRTFLVDQMGKVRAIYKEEGPDFEKLIESDLEEAKTAVRPASANRLTH